MNKIEGDIQEILTDIMLGTLQVLTGMSMGVYGDIPEETAVALSAALGQDLARVIEKAEAGGYSIPENETQEGCGCF